MLGREAKSRHSLPMLSGKSLERRLSRLWGDRLRGGSGQEKTQYGAHCAPERAPFEGRVEGSSLHPFLKGQSEGRGAYLFLAPICGNCTFFKLTYRYDYLP